MVTDNIEIPDGTPDTAPDDTGAEQEENQQSGLTLETLQADIAELKANNANQTRALSAFNSNVGRVQSIVERLEAGKGDTEGLLKRLASQMGVLDESIDAILDDENIDDRVKEKARSVRSKAAASSELEYLKSQIEELKVARPATAPAAGPSFEEEIVDMIRGFDLDPDDKAFDWAGEASKLLSEKGEAETRKYFRKTVKDMLETKAAAARRQVRKDGAITAPPATGTLTRAEEDVRLADSNTSIEEIQKILERRSAVS